MGALLTEGVLLQRAKNARWGPGLPWAGIERAFGAESRVRCELRGIIDDVSEDGKADRFEIAQMVARLRGGDVRALARAVSIVEDGAGMAGEVLAGCREVAGGGLRIGVTGPPGAGKS